MTTTPLRFAALAGAALMLGCTVPGGGPFIGGGPLPLYALAISSVDAETGNKSYQVALDWPSAINARTYEVIRKFGSNASKVLTTTQTPGTVDTGVGAGQSFTYSIRALSGENKELTTSDPTNVTVLNQEVAKPTGLSPADNTKLGVGEVPTFSWTAVPNANWYYVRVTNGQTGEAIYAGLTKDTSLKFGTESPLKLEHFSSQFAPLNKSSITRGIVYTWTVQALRGDGQSDLNKVKALDVNTSSPVSFNQGT